MDNTTETTTIGTYHVFGSGAAHTWFRQTSERSTPPSEFFAAIDATKQDGGNNGFIGTYEVPNEFMDAHGWEAETLYWPPCDSYTPTPQVSDGWLPRWDWLNGGLDGLNAKVPPFRPGYYMARRYRRTSEVIFVETDEEHRKAVLDGNRIIYFADMCDGVHELDYQWGDQDATAFVLIKDGQKLDYIAGCGDRTPFLTQSSEKCLADGKLHYTDYQTVKESNA